MPLPVAECIPWEEIIGPVERETLPSNANLTSAFQRTLILPFWEICQLPPAARNSSQWLHLGKLFPNEY